MKKDIVNAFYYAVGGLVLVFVRFSETSVHLAMTIIGTLYIAIALLYLVKVVLQFKYRD